jgi:hypothetical protein
MQQREMAVLGEPKKLHDAPIDLVKMCEDELDAIRLCIQLSRFTHEFIGKELSIDKGHFSRMMQGQAGFPTTKRLALMRLCGNRAPLQYEAMQAGCKLLETDEFELMVLRQRVKELESRAA